MTSDFIIRSVDRSDSELVRQLVQIHLAAFPGFFLTFMGSGFLRQMYLSYCDHDDSGIFVAYAHEEPVGFLSYSLDMSGLYKFMIRKRLLAFAWYALGALLRRPSVFMRLLRSFLRPAESKRDESYIELSSIAVSPRCSSRGVGSALIGRIKEMLPGSGAKYISLETDALNNERANSFYVKNGFVLSRTYETPEGRLMNEYRFRTVAS